MSLLQIGAFAAAALLVGLVAGAKWRLPVLLAVSLLAVFWLQPASPIRHLDFWLPLLTLGLTLGVWAATRPGLSRWSRGDLATLAALAGLALLLALTRGLNLALLPSPPPQFHVVVVAVLALCGLAWLMSRIGRWAALAIPLLAAVLLGLFLVIKTEPLAEAAARFARAASGQSTLLASAVDLQWLGFSYIAFRLLHVLRDRQSGRLPELSLPEFATYVLFFPSLTAGPIDRAERFVGDLRRQPAPDASRAYEGGRRLVVGLFKKFVLADSLAILALSPAVAAQVTSPLWLWVFLYAYAFRLYLDFSGYTDVAIGIGRLAGIALPENFDRPYLKANLTAFWNSWHITLAQWFRAYFFNPVTRQLRGQRGLPAPVVILIGQLTTMVLIGLWHGVSWNFAVWGAWHGIGLFVHNRWTELVRTRAGNGLAASLNGRLARGLSVFLTFQYVTLGWLWFALPDVRLAWGTLLRLFGA